MHNKLRFAVLVSGTGTTLQHLIDAQLDAEICAVFADRPCLAIERAAIAGIPCQIFPRKTLGREALDSALAQALTAYACDLLLLAGYLSVVGPQVLQTRHIWNMHPSLLPKYKGMYGTQVHRAVLEAGDTFSGCTLHEVVAEIDAGPILRQEQVEITDCKTVEQITSRVQQLEKKVLLQYLQDYILESSSKNSNCAPNSAASKTAF